MRQAALLHLETNCPAGFTMEGNRNVNFAEQNKRRVFLSVYPVFYLFYF